MRGGRLRLGFRTRVLVGCAFADWRSDFCRFGREREVLITDGVGTVHTERGAWSGGVRRRMASASTGPSRLAHPPHRHGRRAVARASAQPPARASPPPLDVVSTTLIVDDLVFHDGTTRMAVLGGGGPQTLFGAGLARRTPPLTLGLVAGIGGDGDCPRECVEWLVDHGVDVRGLMPTPRMPTPRAWQITERDGRRTQVWRLDERRSDELYAMLRPAHSSWPENAAAARCAHFGVDPSRPDVSLCAALRAAGCGLTSVEPFTVARVPLDASELRALCGAADVFSPNEREARSLFVDGDRLSPTELVRRMADAGADVVCLRRGESGAMAYDAGRDEGFECPSVAARVVDETGCGNAFCGAFAASLSRGEGIAEGLALGSAAASVMLEHVGVPPGGFEEYREEAERRAAAARAATVAFSL